MAYWHILWGILLNIFAVVLRLDFPSLSVWVAFGIAAFGLILAACAACRRT